MNHQRNRFMPLTVDATVVVELSLAGWQALMRRAVDATRAGRLTPARHLYQQALDMACALLATPVCSGCGNDDCVAAFVVTHLNLADLCRSADQEQAALAHICTAHHKLMALIQAGDTPPALQQAAWRHSRETHAALLEHMGLHGSHPDLLAALAAGPMPAALDGTRHGATVH